MSAIHQHPAPLPRVDVRVRMSALWTSMMFLFAYVDLFSLYRADVRASIEGGKVLVFDIGQPFLFGVTLYVLVPSLMIYLTLALPRRANRIVNIVAATVYALTIVGSAVGEWGYYILGSIVEAALLVLIVHHAWTWPRRPRPAELSATTAAGLHHVDTDDDNHAPPASRSAR